MDLVTRTDLAALSETAATGPQVSLFMPTHRFGEQVRADPLRWKNLLSGVDSVLAEHLRAREIDDLMAPARRLQQDVMAWQHMSDGLAMFLRAGWHRTLRVPLRVPELATVGDRLVVGPLLRLLSGDEHFLVLALSQREVRLLEGTRHTVEVVELADVPTALREAVAAQEPRSDTMARPASRAGRGGAAVFYGHGAGDDHFKKDEVQRFLRLVATGLRDVLSDQTLPMVLVGQTPLVAAYREVNTYGQVLDDAVLRNPDDLTVEELHAAAWPVVEQQLRDRRAEVVGRFAELHGTGRVSSDPSTVQRAAGEGRVETLFVRADPWCWERVDGPSPMVVRLGADGPYADCERIDAVAVDTLHSGGTVFATSQEVAQDSDLAAIFRY